MTADFEIHQMDCRLAMSCLIEPKSVHTCVTSPPYFGLRDYGHDGQIGLEPTPDEFVAAMVEVFRHVRECLRDDGTLWLNLGDSYCTSPKGNPGVRGNINGGKRDSVEADAGSTINKSKLPGLKAKDLIGIPWRVAFALQADGWYLRQDIIWHKPNPMPESVRDRCTKAHEYIFLFSKQPKYYFDHEALREPSIKYANQGGRPRTKRNGSSIEEDKKQGFGAQCAVTELRSRRSVWSVPTKPFKGAHFATFPPDLIEPCVLAGCPEGGTVLDPFGGAGTTALVANRHNRNAVLCELNPEYAQMAHDRVAAL